MFVEKPACLTWSELDELRIEAADGPPLLVGFNRRMRALRVPCVDMLRTRVSQSSSYAGSMRAVYPTVTGSMTLMTEAGD